MTAPVWITRVGDSRTFGAKGNARRDERARAVSPADAAGGVGTRSGIETSTSPSGEAMLTRLRIQLLITAAFCATAMINGCAAPESGCTAACFGRIDLFRPCFRSCGGQFPRFHREWFISDDAVKCDTARGRRDLDPRPRFQRFRNGVQAVRTGRSDVPGPGAALRAACTDFPEASSRDSALNSLMRWSTPAPWHPGRHRDDPVERGDRQRKTPERRHRREVLTLARGADGWPIPDPTDAAEVTAPRARIPARHGSEPGR